MRIASFALLATHKYLIDSRNIYPAGARSWKNSAAREPLSCTICNFLIDSRLRYGCFFTCRKIGTIWKVPTGQLRRSCKLRNSREVGGVVFLPICGWPLIERAFRKISENFCHGLLSFLKLTETIIYSTICVGLRLYYKTSNVTLRTRLWQLWSSNVEQCIK